MQRIENGPGRKNFRQEVMNSGLVYVDTELPGAPDKPEVVSYWREHARYEFDESETDLLGSAASTLVQMFIDAGDYIINNNLFYKLGIPPRAIPAIKDTWEDDLPHRFAPSIYSRFDFVPILDERDKITGVKMLEFNADTPTSLLESAIIQWEWFRANFADREDLGQFNELFEKLVEAWIRNIKLYEERTGRRIDVVHLAWTTEEESGEDIMNVAMMVDAAATAAKMMGSEKNPYFTTKMLPVEHIVLHETGLVYDTHDQSWTPTGFFTDQDGVDIQAIFKLYPWEWMFTDKFGPTALWNTMKREGTVWIEPPYKALWSNKGILPILWKLFGDKPEGKLLLESYFEGEEPEGFKDQAYVRKALLGREGQNVEIYGPDGNVIETNGGIYGESGYILQRYVKMPSFASQDGCSYRPVLGLWVVNGDDANAGLGIRESPNRITNNTSYFAPHTVRLGV